MATEESVMALIRATRPSFRNNSDKVAFLVHASLLASGFVLTAAGRQAFSDSALSSSSTDEVGIDGWNEVDGEYAFVYANPEKNFKKVRVKCLVMNDKLLVDALADVGSEPLQYELKFCNFSVGDCFGEDGDGNYPTQFKNLDKQVKRSKLDGSSKHSSTTNLRSSETSEGTRTYETELGARVPESLGVPIHPSGVLYPPVNPVGGSDLFPGPGAGMYGPRGDFGSGSMLLGPNDPRWYGGVGEPGFPGAQPGVPPGARFDPYGLPGVPGFEPGRFARGPRRPGSGTHPDLEHFGSGSDFI